MLTAHKNMKIQHIGIIGCGWLGQGLVPALLAAKKQVVATTTQPSKLPLIEAIGAQGQLFKLPIDKEQQQTNRVFCCDALVIAIPPGIRQGKTDYPDKIKQIVKYAEQGKVKTIILISTTAIYDGHIGNVNEETPLKLTNSKVNLLALAEQYVNAFNGRSIVLRCAGLVGPKRHPGKFLKKGRKLSAPNSQVNLIHQKDVVEQIIAVLEQTEVQGTFNLVSDMQVTKRHFYSIAAHVLAQPEPEFDHQSEVELGKEVTGDKLKYLINYQYQYGDLITWLFNSKTV